MLASEPYRVTPFRGEGLQPGVDLADSSSLADVMDAAVAVEHGATWISKDRDFARFRGLRWRHPLDHE
jgi:predicted nucleic acid-binding protein